MKTLSLQPVYFIHKFHILYLCECKHRHCYLSISFINSTYSTCMSVLYLCECKQRAVSEQVSSDGQQVCGRGLMVKLTTGQ